MITHLSGTIEEVRLDKATIDVAGVGYTFFATPATLSTLEAGKQVKVLTHLVVREDAWLLFGFAGRDERDIFSTLITVSGIGPKLALAALAVFSPDELRAAVSQSDLTALTQIPGVGKKSAQRILVEIGDKLGEPSEAGTPPTGGIGSAGKEEVCHALEQLGWRTPLAQKAVNEAAEANPQAGVPELLRGALQLLGKHHA
ncbi:Holliday junction branch migration protein RuvA [Varibaculum prostatecancerukia]|uniref:Holliday junction branch migration protein RuvA n=1 Tax=Varibaculum prostatecancerukia TaxID=2811781 RepID=UPI001C003000|nr:Holliday junction branch migration protein RuvA [Varibaculum prostatecancerukia]